MINGHPLCRDDVRGDFLYKLPRDQRTPANADADRHFVVICGIETSGQCFIYFIFLITLGCKRYRISLLMRIVSLKRMSPPAAAYPRNNDAFGKVKTKANPYHNQNGCSRETQDSDAG